MEDSGYLARAAFIMDRVMHRIGLHGKSFIPLIMGFGCNVPAIMACRTIESRSSRLITILITPFMSCSARLPIYILVAGTFFSANAGLVMAGLYLLGIVAAVVTARLMRRFLFPVDETPFVMELPPYRLPTWKTTLSHMWDKCAQYLKKMGGMILIASLIVWFLSYYPRPTHNTPADAPHYENSYLGKIGKVCEPAFSPLGLNWNRAWRSFRASRPRRSSSARWACSTPTSTCRPQRPEMAMARQGPMRRLQPKPPTQLPPPRRPTARMRRRRSRHG